MAVDEADSSEDEADEQNEQQQLQQHQSSSGIPIPSKTGSSGAISWLKPRARSSTLLPPGVVKPQTLLKNAGELKVEGKVWLANQRTFLRWQHIAIVLAVLSSGLYNAAAGSQQRSLARALGIVYTVISLMTSAWGLGVYRYRARIISQRSGKHLDSIWGPIVIVASMVVALTLNLILKYNAIRHDDDDDLLHSG